MRTTTSATSTGTKAKTQGAALAPGIQNTKYIKKQDTKHKKTQCTSTGTKEKYRYCWNHILIAFILSNEKRSHL